MLSQKRRRLIDDDDNDDVDGYDDRESRYGGSATDNRADGRVRTLSEIVEEVARLRESLNEANHTITTLRRKVNRQVSHERRLKEAEAAIRKLEATVTRSWRDQVRPAGLPPPPSNPTSRIFAPSPRRKDTERTALALEREDRRSPVRVSKKVKVFRRDRPIGKGYTREGDHLQPTTDKRSRDTETSNGRYVVDSQESEDIDHEESERDISAKRPGQSPGSWKQSTVSKQAETIEILDTDSENDYGLQPRRRRKLSMVNDYSWRLIESDSEIPKNKNSYVVLIENKKTATPKADAAPRRRKVEHINLDQEDEEPLFFDYPEDENSSEYNTPEPAPPPPPREMETDPPTAPQPKIFLSSTSASTSSSKSSSASHSPPPSTAYMRKSQGFFGGYQRKREARGLAPLVKSPPGTFSPAKRKSKSYVTEDEDEDSNQDHDAARMGGTEGAVLTITPKRPTTGMRGLFAEGTAATAPGNGYIPPEYNTGGGAPVAKMGNPLARPLNASPPPPQSREESPSDWTF